MWIMVCYLIYSLKYGQKNLICGRMLFQLISKNLVITYFDTHYSL